MNSIIELNIYEYMSFDDILNFKNNLVKPLINNMYDRQNERNTNTFYKNREEKILLGIISEKLIEGYLNKKLVKSYKENLKFQGIIQNNQNIKPDEYDFMFYNYLFDIKSSVEKKEYNGNNFKNFLLKNRNFTLPLDQSTKKKHYIVQVLYNKDFLNTGKSFLCGCISTDLLCKKENLIDLRLNNNNRQKTYMKKIENGKSLLNIFSKIQTKNKKNKKNTFN